MEPEEPSAADAVPPPSSPLYASRVAEYLLSRRHLAAAFELYQDFLSNPPSTERSASRRSGPTASGVGKNTNNDDGDGAGARDDGESDGALKNSDDENEARDALEAYFANPQRFPLADLQRYANVVDSE